MIDEYLLQIIFENYIVFYNNSGERLNYPDSFTSKLVYVKQIPESDSEISQVWREVVPDDLYYTIEYRNKTGWYVQNENETWLNVEDMKKSVDEIIDTCQALYEQDIKK